MRIAVTQPNFLPWLGYFELLDRVDLMVYLDDVLLSPRSFLVRNRLRKDSASTCWVSEAITGKSQNQRICDHLLVPERSWFAAIRNKTAAVYAKSPCCSDALALLDMIGALGEQRVSEFNSASLRVISDYLGIVYDETTTSSVAGGCWDSPEERMLAICQRLGAKEFYNFKNGVDVGLYNGVSFMQKSVVLYKQDYQHPTYQQQFEPFMPYLSIIDLIANHGRDSLAIIRQGTNWVPMDKQPETA